MARQGRCHVVERIARQVDAHIVLLEDRPGDRRVHQRLDELVIVPRLLLGPAQHRKDPGHDHQFLGTPAELAQPSFDIGVKALRIAEALTGGEDHLRRPRREVASRLRGAGLHHHGPSLRRPRDVERLCNVEYPALVVDLVHLARIDEDAAHLVDHQRVVFIGVPQIEHQIDELLGPFIAVGVRRMTGDREILRNVGRRRNDVPSGSALADVIERGELPRQQIRVLVGGRGRRHEPDPLGHLRQCRPQRHRLEMRRMTDPAAHVGVTVAVPAGRAVGYEHHVEQPALGRLRQPAIVVDVVTRIGLGERMPPRRDVVSGRHDEGAQMQFSPVRSHLVAPVSACHSLHEPKLHILDRVGRLMALRCCSISEFGILPRVLISA